MITRPALVLFDLGATLIDDPFEDVLSRLEEADYEPLGLPAGVFARLLDAWRAENRETNHPFASHFLQEEVWPARALLRIHAETGTPSHAALPVLASALLHGYRLRLAAAIARQPQLPAFRSMFDGLQARGITVGVASNDRELATRAMLAWAGLDRDLPYVFTSEGLSATVPGAEKPSPRFFEAALAAIGPAAWRMRVYVGDSEQNDIVPARDLGFATVRYRSPRPQPAVMWRDDTDRTVGDAACVEPGCLLETILRLLGEA